MNDQSGDRYHSQIDSPVDFVPQRVVSLVPSLTESLFDLDLGTRLIGITDYCVHPANRVESVARVGGTKNPEIDRIIAMQPDLVLMDDEENRRADAQALRAAGLVIWVTGPRTVFDVLNLLWNVMDVFDHPVMVPRVREIERAYDYTLGASRMREPVRVFAPVGRDPWMTFDANTYAHDVLRVCGGYNVFAGRERVSPLPDDDPLAAEHDRRYLHVTLEDVSAAEPEVILLPDDPFTAADADVLRALDVPAARTDRIHRIDGSLLTWRGTRVAYALRDLPSLLMEERQTL